MRGERPLCPEGKVHVEGVEEVWADIWLGSLRGTLRSRAEASEVIVENMSRGVMQ